VTVNDRGTVLVHPHISGTHISCINSYNINIYIIFHQFSDESKAIFNKRPSHIMINIALFNILYCFNPEHAEFLKWTCQSSIFGTVHYQYWGYQDENLKLVSQHYDLFIELGQTAGKCTEVQVGLVLYWWQRLTTFGSSRLSINCEIMNMHRCIHIPILTKHIFNRFFYILYAFYRNEIYIISNINNKYSSLIIFLKHNDTFNVF
jgi:hypothetical protein